MFTSGRIAFVIFFVVVFAIALVWSYLKDKKERSANFKGATKIVISVFAVLILLASLVRLLKHI